MTGKPEHLGWLLAGLLCVGLQLALGYWLLVIAGAAGLAVLWWRVRR